MSWKRLFGLPEEPSPEQKLIAELKREFDALKAAAELGDDRYPDLRDELSRDPNIRPRFNKSLSSCWLRPTRTRKRCPKVMNLMLELF